MSEAGFWGRFVLVILATWRVTHLLANEDGPADLVVRLRASLGNSLLGKLMDCFKCLSLWIAAPAALFVVRRPLDWLLTWLAISGAACLLERLGPAPVEMQAISEPDSERIPENTEGDIHHVLRSETIGSAPYHAGETHGSIEESADRAGESNWEQ